MLATKPTPLFPVCYTIADTNRANLISCCSDLSPLIERLFSLIM